MRGSRLVFDAADAVAAATWAHAFDVVVEDAAEFVSAAKAFEGYLFGHRV